MSEKRIARLRELAQAVTYGREAINREFTMRVPADEDRDADCVLTWAADALGQATDALDHIMRVCRNTDVQTKRLLWIEKRAQCAIEGSDDWREYDYPKVRKAAKENHDLRERIEQLETALNWIGDAHIDDMTEIIDYARESAQTAGDTRLEQIDREGEELQTMPLPTSPYPPDSKRRTWWCPMCHEKSDDDGIVRNHKKTCCHYDSALAPPAVACATQTDGDNNRG